MSYNNILLDLNAARERADVFSKAFPSADLNSLFEIDANESTGEILNRLAKSALHERNTIPSLFIYKPMFLEVIARWTTVFYKSDPISVLEASARIITIYPSATSLIDRFLEEQNEHFITILQNPSSQSKENLRRILLAYYRLLYQKKEAFVKYVRPDTLYSILKNETSTGIVKILAIYVLSLFLDMGEDSMRTTIESSISIDESLLDVYEMNTNVNYKFLALNEANRFSSFSKLPDVLECFEMLPDRDYFVIKPDELNKHIVSVCGTLIPKMGSVTDSEKYSVNFVPTEKSVNTLRQLAHSIQISQPVMLLGQSGAGKTFLVNELGKYSGCHDSIIRIHLGEQTDAKLLIGTYASGEKPGTFEWRSGVLTNAVKEGRWVLIEDIDKAPTEVLSILLTLLEKRELIIPSRGEVIKAANGFQLISTVCINSDVSKNSDKASYVPNQIGIRIWNTIHLEEPDDADLTKILCQKFPVLAQLVPKLILSYKSVKSIYLDPRFTSLNRGAHARVVSVRDLVKLCFRLNALFLSNSITKPDQLIESSIYDSIFSEAVDCFAGAISEARALEPFTHCIGESLEIATSRTSLFLTKHVPTFENFDDCIRIGRAALPKVQLSMQKKSMNITSFATTNHSLRLMEQISVACQMTEPVLLVGETGTGKTTVVQEVAKLLNKTLTVINVSQQTETGDLLGGYKPVNSKSIAVPVQELFESLFTATFSLKKNERFYAMLHKCFNKSQWKNVVRLWNEAYKMAQNILEVKEDLNEESKKKKRKLNNVEKKALLEKWVEFKDNVRKFEAQSSTLDNSFVFNFVEGSLMKAVRNGDWLLLDEINLASADTLESISDLLVESSSRSILLSEKGDSEPVRAHPDFRIFGCMNPSTDVGKRDLPPGIRSRFTEIYVHSPDRDISDLLSIIDKYISKYSVSDEWVGNDIAELYLEAKKLAEENKIVDGSNQKPHFSIRTLTRTLLYVRDIVQIYGLRRSLYDGFCMSFLTLLDLKSEELLHPLIEKFTLGRLKNLKSVISQSPPCPGPNFVQFKHYWMRRGTFEVVDQPHYIITPFVEKNMMNLVRATSGKRFPILIQGPTSAGKTSMIKYLADMTGHKFVRINNHEHTDLQEYLGTYITDDTGKLTFQEGILVEALRKGYWIVLDELNLAPTDVLEALNRLLDDNRELFIPETQEIVHPHSDFMLFATQNPPGIYGGRKILSRAFRNRFLELHFDDIPEDELEIIIRERCQIAPTYAKKIVEVYRQLSVERSASRVFEQKNSFATLRDLFRWAFRNAVGYEQLAANGYMLLAERCRTPQEKLVVREVLEKIMKVKLDMNSYYLELEDKALFEIPSSVVWTNALRRLAVLVSTCMKNNEPILLVGETGCGKTTIFQLLSTFMKKKLIILNAHQNTETGDILGAQRPVRNRSEIQGKLSSAIKEQLNITSEKDLDELLQEFDNFDKSSIDEENLLYIQSLRDSLNILFEWCDGPLIHALKDGQFFLLDEISLADDSVLERLNSVLEPERSLLLAEKGSSDSEIVASDGFQFFATMNPGGDYGKKELSPALRNRFTEIWVPSMENFEDVNLIVSSKLLLDVKQLSAPIVDFSEWFGKKFGGGNATNGIISLRDILAWVEFINSTYPEINNSYASLIHGASMVFIDALGTNNTAYLAENEDNLRNIKSECIEQLSKYCGQKLSDFLSKAPLLDVNDKFMKIDLFKITRQSCENNSASFNLTAPTTSSNLMRVVRAMQVHKPILLEGSPGVGKTSLITALAELLGTKLTRINLSEQTDLIDLFGSDAPGEKTGEFVWRDAPFLRAMQKGEWVLLDEMNLASQSVLEGLNACLDHRGEAYIPELDKSFTRHPKFLVFAAQNPQYQGGGRKGLPKSFVNRFSVVYVDMLTADDLLLIAEHLYPNINPEVSTKMIKLMSRLEDEVTKKKSWGMNGAPWEFNLRDTLRWLKLINKSSICEDIQAIDFIELIIKQRFRTNSDKEKAQHIIEEVFGSFNKRDSFLKLTSEYVQINSEVALRSNNYNFHTNQRLYPLECNTNIYEFALKCINNNWPLILVGPSNSGKTEIIRLLGSLLGKEVNMFSLNSDIDSMDILGGYEQVDITRKISYITTDLFIALRELVAINICLQQQERTAINASLRLLDFISNSVVTASNFNQFTELFLAVFSHLSDNLELIEINIKINNLKEILQEEASVKFEWFDGMLIKAVEKGQWLILDNANLCSPSVLDRLNSLLETDGSLIINECSEEDGRPRVIKPHPNFRLFLTVNPKYGELSRAMRNRGIEIYVDALPLRSTKFDKFCLKYDSKDEVECDEETITEPNTSFFNTFGHKLPLKIFIPSYLSRSYFLAQLHDTINASQSSMGLENLVSLMPLNEIQITKEWSENVFSCNFEEKDDIDNFTRFVDYLNEHSITYSMNELYQPVTENMAENLKKNKTSVSDQYISPILNNFIHSTMSKTTSNIYSNDLIYLFAALGMIKENFEDLEITSNKSLHSKINDLSYIESSAAISNGRNIKNPPRIPIFELLYAFNKAVIDIIESKDLFSVNNLYHNLWKFLIIWRSAYETSNHKNEARLRVYKELFTNWVNNNTTDALPIDKIIEINSKFDASLGLTRGHSITLIWESFRKTYPATEEIWKLWEEVIQLSQRFDEACMLQFSDSYESIIELRKLFTYLMDDLLKNNTAGVREMITELHNGIERLCEISNAFLVKRRHYFKDDFDTLLRFVFNGNADKEYIMKLAPLTSVTTEQLVKLQEKSYCFPPVFDLLWKKSNDKFVSHTKTLTSSNFIKNMIVKSNSLKNFPGSQLEQTLSDAKLLLTSTINASPYVLKSQSDVYGDYLHQWIIDIINLHLESDISGLDEDKLRKEVLQCSNDYFITVFDMYLDPVMELLKNTKSLRNLGKAWILFGVALMILYAPDSPYDPAVNDHVTYDVYLKLKSLSDNLINSWEIIRKVTNGDEKIYAESLIVPISNEDIPQKPRVFRPNSSIDGLFEEWSSFLESSISSDQISNLMKMFGNWNNVSENRFEMFQQNTSQFLSRLSTGYAIYADLNDIFSGYVFSMKFGFDLMKEEELNDKKSTSISNLWSIDPITVMCQNNVNEVYDQLFKLFKKSNAENLSVEKILIFFLELFDFHGKDSALIHTFNNVLRSLYFRWSLRRMKAEQETQEQSSMFKYQDKSDDYEADFKEMFPSYDDVLDLEDSEEFTDGDTIDDVYYQLTNAYLSLFGETRRSVDSIITNGSAISELLQSGSNQFKEHSLEGRHLSSMLIKLDAEIKSFKQDIQSSDLDFYRSSSVFESQKAISVINALWKSVHSLLSQWPEHATLKELSRICYEFLEFPASTPLARQIQKIEQIFTFVVEWEKYASSKVSLSLHSHKLSDLIVSWRKLELHTWNCLFKTEDEKCRKNIGKWWFHLFETIIVANLDNETNLLKDAEGYTSLLTSLNVFFSKTTFGEFSVRLELARAFSTHVKLLGFDNSNLSNALDNSIKFYEQFQPMIAEHISQTRKVLEKDVKEVILLASWKDVNIDALKQSSRRSHNNLYKIVRKYRDLLSGHVQSFIENGIPFTQSVMAKSSNLSSRHVRTYDLDSAKVLVTNVDSWSTRSDVLKNIDIVDRNMTLYSKKITSQSYPSFKDLAREFTGEADRLKNETPSTLTKENKKVIASLRAQKAKLFSNALKELRRIGLKTNFRQDIHKVQATSTSVLANTISFVNTELENSDAYFFRILDLLPKLRSVVSSPIDEIPAANIERGMAAAENLIFSLITIRSSMVNLSKDYRKLEKLQWCLESLYLSEGELKHSTISLDYGKFQYICKWLPVLLDYSIQGLTVISNTTDNVDYLFLLEAKSSVGNFTVKGDSYEIYDNSTSGLLSSFDEFLQKLLYTIDSKKTLTSGFIFDTLSNWIISASKQGKISASRESSLSDVDHLFRKVYTSIILSFQKTMNNDMEPIQDSDDKWLQTSTQRVMQMTMTLNSSKVVQNIENATNLLKESIFSTTDTLLVKAIIGFTMPVVNHYYKVISSVLQQSMTFYENMSQGSFLLSVLLYNLAKNGFCSPEPPSEEKHDDNLHEGTGLGDGEGAQNNSNDIEQDDDLTEDAQQQNKEKDEKKQDEEEDDNAVEMEGDMAGDLEDLSDQDNDEDVSDEDQEDELDEEIDDLNEDDPNAIDDKMWDEQAAEDSKEKETEENLNNNADDADVEAGEDNESNNNDNGEQEAKDADQDENNDPEINENSDSDQDGDNDEDGEEEEDVGEQEDEVRNEEGQSLDPDVPDVETMDIPEDMNLDSDENNEGSSEQEQEDEFMNESEEDEEKLSKEERAESDVENLEDQQNQDEDVDMNDFSENDDNEQGPDDEANEEPEGTENDGMTEEPIEDGEISDEEVVDQTDEKKKETGGEDATEGLDSVDDVMEKESNDADASVQQQSGSKGTGSDAKDEEEQEDMGNFGNTQNPQEEQADIPENESSRQEANEALKQLGDSMKEFHRRRQEIQEASNNGEQEDEPEAKNERIDEFEHVDGANTETDTQAMGSANQDEIQTINEENAIDDDITQNDDHEMKPKENEAIDSTESTEIEDVDGNIKEEPTAEPNSKGGFIGERKDLLDFDDPFGNPHSQLEDVDDLEAMIDEIDLETHNLNLIETPPRSMEESRLLWNKSEIATADLVSRLGEQLRLILEPTLATNLRGDYKTGKRLNMKRIIPYIASQFRKDKIWLRRTKPSKRQYQIMIALDDSKSMSESNCVNLAFDSVCLVSKTLTQLESGGLSIVKFGESTKEVHSFDQQFSNESGVRSFQWFGFQDSKTDIKKLVSESIKIFERARSYNSSEEWQLEIIISDGICEDHETVQRLVRRARENKIMLVFVIIDGITSNESIMDMSQVKYIPDQFGNMQLKIDKYLDTFPFEFYVVVHDVSELPEMLSAILRQYFSDLAMS